MADIIVKRFEFLEKLYNESEQDEFKFCNAHEIGDTLGFDQKTIDKIVRYFVRENFIERKGPRGIIAITHLGICNVESIYEKRAKLINRITKKVETMAKAKIETKCAISQGKLSMSKKTIFISHANEDAPLAKVIKTQIDKVFGRGLNVFVSSVPGIIVPGSDWLDKIINNLTRNDVFIVLFTPYSKERSFVWFEIGFSWLRMLNESFKIYTLCVPPIIAENLPEPLCRLQAISLADEEQTTAFFTELINQFNLGNLDTLEFTKIRESLPEYDEENSNQTTRRIRSEVICNEVNKLLLNGTWHRANLLISHLSKSFPKRSVVNQLTKMENDGLITWGDGPMKPDSKVHLVKSTD